MDIIEDPGFFEVEPYFLSENFPWFYPGDASFGSVQAHYHLLLSRNFNDPKVISNYYTYFEGIFRSFCEKHSVPVNKVFGAAVHQTLDSRKQRQPFHVDFHFEHKVLIMYLTDDFNKGRTLITDLRKTENGPVVVADNLKTRLEVEPKAGKVICFDGSRYHAAEYPVDGRRIVCIFTFF
jgi:hypothetical protein